MQCVELLITQISFKWMVPATNVETQDRVITLTVFTTGLERILSAVEERALFAKTDALVLIVSGDDKQDLAKLGGGFVQRVQEYKAKYNMEAQPIWLIVVSSFQHSAQLAHHYDKIAIDNKWQIKFVANLEQIQIELGNLAKILQDLGCKPRAKTEFGADTSRSRHFESSRFEHEFDRLVPARESKNLDLTKKPEDNKGGSTTVHDSGRKEKRASIFDDTDDRILNKKHKLNEQMNKDLMHIQEVSFRGSMISQNPIKK